jgi:hypothetical protein
LLAAARTGVPHPGAEGPDALERYWLGEALIWVLRVRLLAELGVPISQLSARVTPKPAFQDVLSELAKLRPSTGKLKTLGVDRPDPAELDHLVEIRTWDAPCYEFAHFTDQDLADGIIKQTTSMPRARLT